MPLVRRVVRRPVAARLARFAARVAPVAAALALAALGGQAALAADPEPPNSSISWGGSPNVPVWATFNVGGTAGSDPIDHLECRLDDGPWEVCTSPWDPELTGGERTVAVRAVDVNGLADPTPDVGVVWVDTEGPIVTVSINDGAATTGRPRVRVDARFQDHTSVFHVRISGSPELDDQGRLANARETQVGGSTGSWDWRLDDAGLGGSSAPGPHTVYVQGEDAFGNWNVPVAATITLDPDLEPASRIRLAVSENPAPIGDRVIVFALVEAVDGAAIVDGKLTLTVAAPNCACTETAEGWPVENGVFVDASRLAPGSYKVTAWYTGSQELADDTATLTLQIGPERSLMGPHAYFSAPTPWPSWDQPVPFTLPIDSRFDEAVSFQCRIDQGPWSPCADEFAVGVLAAGSHIAEVRGTDRGGRVQAVPDMFVWRSAVGTAGQVWVDPQTGVSGNPVVGILSQAPPGALAMRLSSVRTVDVHGRLAAAKELSPPPTLAPSTPWDMTDPAYGGTAGDGRKLIWLQWQLADGTWTIPELYPMVLDREAPDISLKIENGNAFVDEDQLLVVAKASERVRICVGETPDAVSTWGCGATPVGDGLGLLPWPAGDVPPGEVSTRTLYAAAYDDAGNWSPVVSASITIDRSDPVARLRPVALVKGSSVSSSTVAMRIRGSATDTGSGVRRMLLQEVGGSRPTTVGDEKASSVAVERRVPFAASRSWRTRGVDRLGHVGAWAAGALVRPIRRDDDSATITYRGAWARVVDGDALGNALHRARRAGATASITFTGRAVGIVAPRGAGLGKADVLVDGVRVETIDLRASSAGSRVVVFARSWATAGEHTVTLRVRGTPGRPTVSLDAVVVVP